MHPTDRPELLGTRLFDLTDKIALVTGAGRGVGRTVALALAAAGDAIVACARTAPEIEALSTEVRSLGRRAEAIVTDVTDEASCEHLIATTVERLGGLDILVNNAGIGIVNLFALVQDQRKRERGSPVSSLRRPALES